MPEKREFLSGLFLLKFFGFTEIIEVTASGVGGTELFIFRLGRGDIAAVSAFVYNAALVFIMRVPACAKLEARIYDIFFRSIGIWP